MKLQLFAKPRFCGETQPRWCLSPQQRTRAWVDYICTTGCICKVQLELAGEQHYQTDCVSWASLSASPAWTGQAFAGGEIRQAAWGEMWIKITSPSWGGRNYATPWSQRGQGSMLDFDISTLVWINQRTGGLPMSPQTAAMLKVFQHLPLSHARLSPNPSVHLRGEARLSPGCLHGRPPHCPQYRDVKSL